MDNYAIDNYGALKEAVLSETHRPDLAPEVKGFIRRAEGMIARKLRAVEMIVQTTLSEAQRVDAGVYTLPDDFLEARAVWVPTFGGRSRWVEQRSLAEIRAMPPTRLVQWYALIGNNRIEFRGTPSQTEIVLDYFARLAPLVNDEDTNLLLTKHEEIYLASACFYACRHTQDLELAQGYLDSFNDACESLNEQAGRHLGSPTERAIYTFGSSDSGGY